MKNKPGKRKLSGWKRTLLVVFFVVIIIYTALAVLFNTQKDEIQAAILNRVNQMQPGELVIKDISFSPFAHFPDVAITLEEARYYETKSAERNIDSIPIIVLKRLDLAFNVLDLIRKDINVSRIRLEDGTLNLATDDSGALNLLKAVGLSTKEPDKSQQKTKAKPPSSPAKPKPKPAPKQESGEEAQVEPFSLNLDHIKLRNIKIGYIDSLNHSASGLTIDKLDASLHTRRDTLRCKLSAEMLLDSVTLIQRLTLRKKPMVIKTTLAFSDDLKKIKVEPSRYTFDHAHFEGQGNIDTEGDGYIDMIFKGDDEGFSVSNLFLTNSGVENIEKGNLFFEGTVKGKLFKGRPSFEGSFGIDGLQVQIHNTNRRIRNLNLKGSYHSGEKKDFSDAWLNVSKFNAILPDGKLDCKLKIENMAEPWVDLDFYLKANVTDFDKVFELENVKNMSGKLEVSTAYIGQLVVKDNTIENFNGQASLYFDKVALKSQQGNDLKQITGGVVLRDSTLIFDYLNVFYEKSNFKLNGSVTNTSPIILDAIKKLNETSTSENKKVNQEYHVSQFDIDCFMAIEAGDFEEELRKAGLDSLTGSIELTTNLKGDFNWQSSGLENYTGRTSLSFNKVSFNINEVGEVKEIDGEILLEDEDLLFKGFMTVFGNSDFLINGELKNTMAVLLDEEKTIDGTLNIKSDMFDFPDMFAWNQKTAKGFPFQTKNLDLTVSPKTTTEQLHNFVKIPEIEFTINKLEAEILELTPPVTVQSGVFTLADRDSVVYLDFSDFNIDLPEGNLLANVRFNPPVGIHKRLKIDVDLKNANPVKDLAPFLPDTVPEELSGVLNAKLNLDLLFSKNPKGFKKIELTSDEMSFVNSTDTLDLKGLQLKAEDFYYTSGENALKTLSFNAGISFRNLIANNIHTSKLNYSVETIDGVFRVVSNKSPLFDGQGFGLFVLRPFDDVPSYEFNYKMDQFDVSHLLETFNRENVIDGKMDFDLYLTISGNTKEELLKSMDGHLKIYGQHIILYGIDLDKLIERFERTQRFTIADVGFGLVLGPAGLLLSKGTNYTRMAIKNKDQTSEINEFLTDYKINNGIMKLEDVALATKRSRLAAKGSVDLNSEQLDLTIAVLNRSGCSLFSQVVGGSVGEPERGKAKVAKVLLAPITNLAKPIKCKPFYEGKVKDPRVKK